MRDSLIVPSRWSRVSRTLFGLGDKSDEACGILPATKKDSATDSGDEDLDRMSLSHRGENSRAAHGDLEHMSLSRMRR